MSHLLCIDPGTKGVGAAVFHLGSCQLQFATYIPGPIKGRRLDSALALAGAVEHRLAAFDVAAVACEVMRSYDAQHQKGPQDDLIDVSLVSAAIADRFAGHGTQVITYYPSEWKGNLNPETCLERIVQRLSPGERAMVKLVGRLPLERVPGSDSLDHNTLDACGIGLYKLGRFAPARVFARE